MAEPIVVGWSGGKDSTLTLARLLRDPRFEVAGLLTTVTGEYDRVSIHGVRRALLEQQAAALGLPLVEAILPPAPSNQIYEEVFGSAVTRWRERIPELRRLAFGDLFLADIRRYREAQLERLGMSAVFPVWGEPTDALARQFIREGYHATVVCVDLARLPASCAGRRYDEGFISGLLPGVDPCGENGEFHTFVSGGPVFKRTVGAQAGQVVVREGFAYADLLPADADQGLDPAQLP